MILFAAQNVLPFVKYKCLKGYQLHFQCVVLFSLTLPWAPALKALLRDPAVTPTFRVTYHTVALFTPVLSQVGSNIFQSLPNLQWHNRLNTETDQRI